MADLVFAFDPALDRPLAVPDDAPPAVAEVMRRAVGDAFAAAVATALRGKAAALVVCGRLLDPLRASPAQAAALRAHVVALAAEGCRTVVVADGTAACHDLARLLGEPAGLEFVTPLVSLELAVHGLPVEIVSTHAPTARGTGGDTPAPLARRIVVGCDAAEPESADFADETGAPLASAAAQPGTLVVWGSRRRPLLPSGALHVPSLQARDDREPAEGACCGLALVERAGTGHAPRADWRSTWQEIPTRAVAWHTVTVESQAGGDEELGTTIWASLEALAPQAAGPLVIVRCAIQCGTSVARRVRVGEIAAETLARVRQLYDQQTFRVWVREVFADPTESLAPLGHERSGGRPGSTTSFSSALADLVVAAERSPADAADAVREAGWLALELVEST